MASYILEEACVWASTADTNSKLHFIKELFKCYQYDELKVVGRLLDNSKKRKSPNRHYTYAKQQEKKKAKLSGQFDKAREEKVVDSDSAQPTKCPSVDGAQKSISIEQKSPEAGGNGHEKNLSWWEAIGANNILSMDCEMVTLFETNSYGKHIQQAATVSIVDWDEKVILEETIFHAEGSFMINKHTERITGFKGQMLEDGKPMAEVREKVRRILEEKHVITHGGATDFSSLDIEASQIANFDLQSVFRKWTGTYTKQGEKVFQPIGLRTLYHHYFGTDIQNSNHSATVDALAAMKLFKQIYVTLAKDKGALSKNYVADGEFDHIEKLK